MYLRVVPPAKCLMSSYPDNSTSLPLCIDRNALRVSARHFVLEDSFTDAINSKRHSQNQEGNTTEGCTLIYTPKYVQVIDCVL